MHGTTIKTILFSCFHVHKQLSQTNLIPKSMLPERAKIMKFK